MGDNAATNRGNAMDLGAVTPFPTTERIMAQIVTTAGNGANNKNVTTRWQHANVNANVNFINIAGMDSLIIPEVSASYAVTTLNQYFPGDVRQFVRLITTTESSGGNASNGTVIGRILF